MPASNGTSSARPSPGSRCCTPGRCAGTHAGLVAGLAVMGADIPVLGIGVRAPREAQEANVYKLAR